METPRVNICLLGAEFGLCVGCGHIIDEIANWASMTEDERRAIMGVLPARLERLENPESETA